VGQERLGPFYFFIPLVLGPLNSLVWYVASLRYTCGLGWRMHFGVEVTESSTNKQHHLPPEASTIETELSNSSDFVISMLSSSNTAICITDL
jgi:hypothetical protein